MPTIAQILRPAYVREKSLGHIHTPYVIAYGLASFDFLPTDINTPENTKPNDISILHFLKHALLH